MVEEEPLKHLEFIQNIITRMANNSFLLKGWTVTIVSALFALAAQNSNSKFIILALFPVIAFWILDSYYLWQERLFRELYNDIRNKTKNDIQSAGSFSLDTKNCQKNVHWLEAVFSKTIILFYGVIIITIFIVMAAIGKTAL